MFIPLKANKIKLLLSLLIIINFICTPVLADSLLPEQPGARIFLLPDKASYLNSDNLILNIIIDPEQKAFNAAEINLNFPSDLLSINKITYSSSSCPVLAEEIINNQAGSAKFTCGTSTRELNFKAEVAKITFNKIKSGWAKINLSGSKVLAADGLGTNILNSTEIHNLLIIK